MTEQECLERISEIVDGELYIILSNNEQFIINDMSIPYIGMLDAHTRVVFAFESVDDACRFIDNHIRKTNKDSYYLSDLSGIKMHDFVNICSGLFRIGANKLEMNSGTPNVFGFDIGWLLKEFDYDHNKFDGNKMEVSMFKIFNFSKKGSKDSDREKLKKQLLSQELDLNGYFELVHEKISIGDICYLSDWVNTEIIPSVDEDKMLFWGTIANMLIVSAWDKIAPTIKTDELYVLRDKNSNKYYEKDGYFYFVYTREYEEQGIYVYEKVKDSKEIIDILEKNEVNGLVLTDGPNYMCVIDIDRLIGIKVNVDNETVFQKILSDKECDEILDGNIFLQGEIYRAQDAAPYITGAKDAYKLLRKDFSEEKEKEYYAKAMSSNEVKVLRGNLSFDQGELIYPTLTELYNEKKNEENIVIPCFHITDAKIIKCAIYTIVNGEERLYAYTNSSGLFVKP